MKNFVFFTFAAGLVLGLAPQAAQAKDAPAVPPEQSRIFALGYTLRACDLRAQDYIEAVQALKTIGDNDAVTAETIHRSRDTPKLRRTQAVAYTQAARLLGRMGAPPAIQTWGPRRPPRASTPPWSMTARPKTWRKRSRTRAGSWPS